MRRALAVLTGGAFLTVCAEAAGQPHLLRAAGVALALLGRRTREGRRS